MPTLQITHATDCPSDRLPRDILPTWQIAHVTDCPRDRLSTWQIAHATDCPRDRLSTWQISHVTDCPCDRLPTWQIAHVTDCPRDRLPIWQIAHATNCPRETHVTSCFWQQLWLVFLSPRANCPWMSNSATSGAGDTSSYCKKFARKIIVLILAKKEKSKYTLQLPRMTTFRCKTNVKGTVNGRPSRLKFHLSNI